MTRYDPTGRKAKVFNNDQYHFGYTKDEQYNVRESTTPFLNLELLRKEEKNSEKNKKQIYKLILSKCHKKIRRTNSTTEYRECFYDVPIFLPGYPVYSIESAKAFLFQQLSAGGLYVENREGPRIYISWRDEDVNLDLYYQQAKKMTPKPNVYQIAVSPLDERSQQKTSHRKPKIFQGMGQDSKVSMLQYDDKLADMVPVNTSKVSKSNLGLDKKIGLVIDDDDQSNYRQINKRNEINDKRNQSERDYLTGENYYQSSPPPVELKPPPVELKPPIRPSRSYTESVGDEYELEKRRRNYMKNNVVIDLDEKYQPKPDRSRRPRPSNGRKKPEGGEESLKFPGF